MKKKRPIYLFGVIFFLHLFSVSASEDKKALLFFHGGGGIVGHPDDQKNITFTEQLKDKYEPIIHVEYKYFWEKNNAYMNAQQINKHLSDLPEGKDYDVIAVSAGAYVFVNAAEKLIKRPKHFFGISPMLTREGNYIVQFLDFLYKKRNKQCSNTIADNPHVYSFPLSIIHGSEDRIIVFDELQKICEINKCDLHEIKYANHFLLEEKAVKKIIQGY